MDDESAQRRLLNTLHAYNSEHNAPRADTPFAARIASYEMAFSMQRHAPEAIDLGSESEDEVIVGLDEAQTQDFGSAPARPPPRRARGAVRALLLRGAHNDTKLGAHGDLVQEHPTTPAAPTSRSPGLLTGPQAPRLLDESLVIWGGEFGRQADGENAKGRAATTTPMASDVEWPAAGIKGGVSVGETERARARPRLRPHPPSEPPRPALSLLGPQPREAHLLTTASTRSSVGGRGAE